MNKDFCKLTGSEGTNWSTLLCCMKKEKDIDELLKMYMFLFGQVVVRFQAYLTTSMSPLISLLARNILNTLNKIIRHGYGNFFFMSVSKYSVKDTYMTISSLQYSFKILFMVFTCSYYGIFLTE